MQTDTRIEVISPYRCYDCSRHTEMNFYNILYYYYCILIVLFHICIHTSNI